MSCVEPPAGRADINNAVRATPGVVTVLIRSEFDCAMLIHKHWVVGAPGMLGKCSVSLLQARTILLGQNVFISIHVLVRGHEGVLRELRWEVIRCA